MLKSAEVESPSYLMRAWDGEMLFVLLARDEAAPVAIKAWAAERLRLGKNSPEDAQITEVLQYAETMARQRELLCEALALAGESNLVSEDALVEAAVRRAV